MEVIVGKTSGFCGGVIRSVNETMKVLNEYGETYCLGELVHNKQVVGKLENDGLILVENITDVPDNSRVIIRAHGVPKDVYNIANEKNLELIDLTCLKVIKIHELVGALVKDGYFIVLTGQKNHPEAIGTISFCGENCTIIENIDEVNNVIEMIKKSNLKKVAIIAQTTYSMDNYDKIVDKLKEMLDSSYEFNIQKTICNATELRQNETKELAANVDAMIIIGGKNSSNTKKLYEIASEVCKSAYIIETAEDLGDDFSKYSKIGIMAGASTPKESVDGVLEYLKSFDI